MVGGWERSGVGGGGRWEAEGGIKQSKSSAVPSVFDMN